MDQSLQNKSYHTLGVATLIIIAILFVGWLVGSNGPHLMSNDICFDFLGCNVGFGGLDALLHLVSGVGEVVALVWLSLRNARLSLFQEKFWKNMVIVISIASMIILLWEVGELGLDQFRATVLDKNLIAKNELYQPNNLDTMGDVVFSLVGAAITGYVLRSRINKGEYKTVTGNIGRIL